MSERAAALEQKRTQGSMLGRFRRQGYLQVFAIAGALFFIIFHILPLFGLVIAFKEFRLTDGFGGFFRGQWVGLKYFKEFFTDLGTGRIIRNTVVISLLKLVFVFPAPIFFAIAVDETRRDGYKRIVQTVSYLPHFISWVVVSGLMFTFLNQRNGLLNQFLVSVGLVDDALPFLTDAGFYWPVVVLSDVWKSMGWWSIIFLAAISSINPELYDAAYADGAKRSQRIWHITLPGIRGTVVIILILNLGKLFGGGLGGSNFQQAYLLGNPLNYNVSEILQTYTLNMGLALGRYSYATAIGLVESIVSLLLIFSSNKVASRISDSGLF